MAVEVMVEGIANAMTIDVEEYFHAEVLSESFDPAHWGSIPGRVEANTDRLLGILADKNVHATFFVLGWIGQRYPQIVRKIQSLGHEVACHGMSHKLIYEQTPDVFKNETRQAKSLLEDITGEAVIGYRAASFSITRRSLWALDILAEVGFRYDSSIYPVRRGFYGIPDADPWPHVIELTNGSSLIEFPPTSFRILKFNIPASGGGFFRAYPYALSRFMMRRTNYRLQRPCIFYMHPWEIDVDQPRVDVSLKSRFRHYLNLHRTESRLHRLLDDLRFETVRFVLEEQGLFEMLDQPTA